MAHNQTTEHYKLERLSREHTKSDQTFLRRFNHRKVLNILRTAGPMSRIDLAKASQLDKKTITNIVADMLKEGQVHTSALQKLGNGRPKELLALSGAYCHCIGVDIGGTHITAVLLNFAGDVLSAQNIDLRTNVTPYTVLDLCDLLVDSLLRESGMSMDQVSGIGVTFPGILDHKSGKTLLVDNLPDWNNVPVKQIFEDKYQKPVVVEDCSRAMALAEHWFDEAGCRDFIVFDLGLGIGCGIVINNSLFMGSGGKSGEVGHMIVEVGGPPCTCGRKGCIEALSSGWALSQQAQALLEQGKAATLRSLMPESEKKPSIKDVILAAKIGDESCRELLVRAGEYIGIGIANSLSLFNPAKIVLGGRMIKDNDFMRDSIIETVRKQTIEAIYRDTQIVLSEIGDNASAIGAAILYLRQHYS